jgi:hypothetical protein
MDVAGPQPSRHPHEQDLSNPKGWDFYLATTGDHNLAVDTSSRPHSDVKGSPCWAVVKLGQSPEGVLGRRSPPAHDEELVADCHRSRRLCSRTSA